MANIVSLPLVQQLVNGTTADATQVMADLNQIATNVNANAIAANGSNALTANLPAGGFKLTGLGPASSNGDSVRYEDLVASGQQQTFTAFTTAGTAPNFTLTPVPAISAYAAKQRFNVTFNAAGTTGSNTLNISALGAQNLKQYDPSGLKIPAIIPANLVSDVEYDGTDFMVLSPPTAPQIQTVSASVASNALTVGIGAGVLQFRSATLATGTPNTRSFPALSLVVPSGATLGTVNAVQSRLILLDIDNGGTVELAIVNLAGGNDLTETGLISTTAISAAATNANVIYSTTARTNVPYRVVGYVESTQATAGTWATAPSTVQGYGGQALAAMSSFGYGQTWQDVTASRAAGTPYKNSTGKLIHIYISVNASAAGYCTLTLNGVTFWSSCAIGAGNPAIFTLPVPPGGTYTLAAGNVAGLLGWSEFR